MDTFFQTLRNLGPMRLTVMGAVLVGLVVFFVYLVSRLANPPMALLYGNLDAGDSSRIVSQLDGMNVPYRLQNNGAEIQVPVDQVSRLRVSMAEQGLPSGGTVGYEIFDESGSIGTTDFVQNVNLVRALEGELARTIGSIDMVRAARVHLVMPKRELFSRERAEPSASVILKMRSSARLANEQVSAIRHVVAAAVPGLVPTRISVVDDKGSLLADGFDEGDGPGAVAAKTEERRRQFESRMARTIEGLLEKVIGMGKVRAEVSADMDFDRISTNEEVYDPDGQVVRSTQTVEETASSNETESPPVTVDANLPNPAGGAEGPGASTEESRVQETVNYEISRKVVSHVREAGIVKRMTVAVLVDGTYATNGEGGERVYQPRGEQEMDQIASLVRNAIGFDAERGDTIEVTNMQFAAPDEIAEEPSSLFMGFGKNDVLRIAEILVLSIVAILVILLVVRPLLTRAFEALPTSPGGGPAHAEGRLLVDESVRAPALARPMEAAPGEDDFEELIDIDRVEGRVKASSVKKVGEIVDKHPAEALSIVRSWMYQET